MLFHASLLNVYPPMTSDPSACDDDHIGEVQDDEETGADDAVDVVGLAVAVVGVVAPDDGAVLSPAAPPPPDPPATPDEGVVPGVAVPHGDDSPGIEIPRSLRISSINCSKNCMISCKAPPFGV